MNQSSVVTIEPIVSREKVLRVAAEYQMIRRISSTPLLHRYSIIPKP